MKKVILVIAICAMVSPAINADPITINVAASNITATTADVTISYSGATGLKPYGISMVVDPTADAAGAGSAKVVAVGDVSSVDSFFDVFIDLASDEPNDYLDPVKVDPCTGIWEPGQGAPHPLAKEGSAGAPTFPVLDAFSLCMGELAQTATIPASKDLVVITFTKQDGVGAGTGCTIRIDVDDLRGNIVDPNGNPLTPTVALPIDLPIVWADGVECFPNGAAYTAQYNDWVNFDRPDCWCAAPAGSGYQCHGDVDGVEEGAFVKYRIYTQDLAALQVPGVWKSSTSDYPANPGIPCADVTHSEEGAFVKYRVYLEDLARVIPMNWKQGTAAVPQDCPLTDAANSAYVDPTP